MAAERPGLGPVPARHRHPVMELGRHRLVWGERTWVMGIVNVTPDSFSGDGVVGIEAARQRARLQITAGADLIDVGGSSTRPGAPVPDEVTEAERVLPAVAALVDEGVPVSVDTFRPRIADAALAAGAVMVNDVSALADPDLATVAAAHGAGLCVMWNQRDQPATSDPMGAVIAGLSERVDRAMARGMSEDRIMLDPGFGFGWSPPQNLALLRDLPRLVHLGFPVLVGTSRKSTLGWVLDERGVEDREHATSATSALAVAGGADLVRVHDVASQRDVVRVADAICR